MDLRDKKFRPQVIRAFQRWHEKNKAQLPCRLLLTSVTATSLRFAFDGIDPSLSLLLRRRGFDVDVTWQGVDWDMLISYDCSPKRTTGRYYCGLCTEAASPIRFDSIDTFWEEHLFAPLVCWLKTRLMPARFLYLVGTPDAFTWATLRNQRGVDFKDPRDVCLSVHLYPHTSISPATDAAR